MSDQPRATTEQWLKSFKDRAELNRRVDETVKRLRERAKAEAKETKTGEKSRPTRATKPMLGKRLGQLVNDVETGAVFTVFRRKVCEVCGGPLKNKIDQRQHVRFCSKTCRLRRHNMSVA